MNYILIIDRRFWLRGGKNYKGENRRSVMIDNDGLKCCLGFYALAQGVCQSDLINHSTPASVVNYKNRLYNQTPLKDLITSRGTNNDVCGWLIVDNDDSNLSSEDRERHIKTKFEILKVDLLFSDDSQALAQKMREEYAYHAWQNAGSPEGRDLEFWQQAENFIKAP